MSWTEITKKLAKDYGATNKGRMLEAIGFLCDRADDCNGVRYEKTNNKIGITGQLPLKIADIMRGMHALFNEKCYVLTTHDLNSFSIPSIGELVTEIRLSN